MNFENIQMTIARRSNNNSKINISQINETNRHDKYECIVCGSEVIPVAPNGKIICGNDAKVTPHFKHLNAEKCGQESFIHFWMKTEFIKIGDKFKVITDKENEYICNQILFEKTIVVDGRKYTPDATVLTSCGNTIHFEYNYSNRKKIKDYIDIWKELNHIVIEVDMNSILCVFSDSIPTFNALYYDGKCFNLDEEDSFYFNTIGKYKLTKHDQDVLHNREIEIEKLDYLWDEIRKIKYENKDYNEIGNLIRSISSEESRKIAIDILSRAKCGNSILNNYVSFIKTNIDKRLKLLNLKYNGYLIRYKTFIPYHIYDRIFVGISIALYVPDSENPEFYQTYNYNFKEEILSDSLKSRIDNVVKELSNTHTLLLNILDVLQKNDKIINSKFNYKQNTDYIDAIYFEDYRNKHFVLGKDLEQEYIQNIFGDFNNKISFININNICYYNSFSNSFYVAETKDSYIFNNIYYKDSFIRFKFDNFINQASLNLSYYKVDNNYKYLLRYNFTEKTSNISLILEQIEEKIEDLRKNFINTEYFKKVYKKGESIEIIDININKKLGEQLLYPITHLSNKCDSDTLNIILNKEFTKDEFNKTRGWLIKDFIDVLERIGITGINNIE